MGKPVKGNKTKRPPSDEVRLKRNHLLNLKRNKAVVSTSFNVPEGFKVSKVSKNLIRFKGLGAQAIKLSKGNIEVIRAVKDRNWNRVVSLVPMETPISLNYEPKKKEEVVVETSNINNSKPIKKKVK